MAGLNYNLTWRNYRWKMLGSAVKPQVFYSTGPHYGLTLISNPPKNLKFEDFKEIFPLLYGTMNMNFHACLNLTSIF